LWFEFLKCRKLEADQVGYLASFSFVSPAAKMNFKLVCLLSVGVCLMAVGFAAQSLLVASEPPKLELWYQHASFINSDDRVRESKELIDKAVAAGYTGALFWDSSWFMMGNKDWDPDNEDRLKEVLKYAKHRHLKTVAEAAPYGWSNDVLAVNPNWGEAQRVVGAQFQVTADGKSLQLKNSFPGLVNGDFESGKTGWFEMGDPNLEITPDAHGGHSALAIVDPPGNARITQTFSVQPWRQYHLSFAYKAVGPQLGGPMVLVMDPTSPDVKRLEVYLKEAKNWVESDYLFNSGSSTTLRIYAGVWGGARGTIELDDIKLEETDLVWVTHRQGAPFKLYDPQDPSKVYTAGSDYNEPIDPDMAPHRPSFHNIFHWPPPFTLPSTTQLKPGQIVAADYYAITPMTFSNQVGMCLTEPGTFRWLAKNANEIKKVVPSGSDVLLYYDEMRQGNSCAGCRAMNMSAGELLAWNFRKTYGIYHEALSENSVWVWNDMFDKYHNAHGGTFYQVESNWEGSWKGLPPEVSIMNWNLGRLKESLTFFSGLDPEQPIHHDQMIAGFYEKPDANAEARQELHDAAGIPGIRGVMYTTWENNYSKLKDYADGARAAWPAYLDSLQKK